MAQPSAPPPVKLFVATLHVPGAPLEAVIDDLKGRWGALDFTSRDFPFQVTNYYEKEMGTGLMRRFLSFRDLVSPEILAEAKIFTNLLELRYAGPNGRCINLDPGYLDFYKVVLASTKHGGQKVYLRDGIYADMTLVMHKSRWESFAWGFPDFKSGTYDEVLSRIRDLYKEQVRPIR